MSLRKCIGCGLLLVVGILGFSSLLFADSSLSTEVPPPIPTPAPPSASPNTPAPALPAADTGANTPTATSAPASAPASASSSSDHLWISGRLPFRISASLGEVYDDNIFIQRNKTSDFITQLGARAEIKFGDPEVVDGNYLDGYYAPSGSLYANHSDEDFLNQDVGLLYQHRFTRLVLSLEQSYAKTTETSISIGNLVRSDVYTTNAKADYAYSDKLDITSSISQVFTSYNTSFFTSSREWINDEYFLYKLDSKLSIGIGPKFGFLDFDGSPFQTYQQILPRLKYDYSGKLTFQLAGGAEYRQFDGGGRGDVLTAIYDVSGTYQPYLDTTITLRGSRHYVPAYGFVGQDYLATDVDLTGRQRFLQKFYLNLALGYENDSYLENVGSQFSNSGPSEPDREDNYFFARVGLDWTPNTWLTVSSYYKYQNDDSNFSSFSFDDNQVGFSIEGSY